MESYKIFFVINTKGWFTTFEGTDEWRELEEIDNIVSVKENIKNSFDNTDLGISGKVELELKDNTIEDWEWVEQNLRRKE